MKWLIVVINLIVLVNSIAAVARQEKIIKKPFGMKPSKMQKTIIDEFRNLSPEDVEFLKQVDKQYKVHGDKIKIKVERENSTFPMNKNTKRTIDTSLGYGNNQYESQQSYYFSQPHLMHQFTLKDVPGSGKPLREKATDIVIQQSQSYEITDYEPSNQHSVVQSYHQNNQQEQVYEDPIPVIVLRVPGPQKYALHLQALLQQYLEIRAEHYIKELENQEKQGHLMHPQHYVAQQQQQMRYVPMVASPLYHQQFYHQSQQNQQQYQHQMVYPNYYQQQQELQQQQQEHQQQQQIPAGEQSYYQQPQIPAGEQSYYQQQPQGHQEPQAFQNVPKSQHQEEYPSSYINFVTPGYDQVEVTAIHNEPEHHEHRLETSENYPSDKHTQVIFKPRKKSSYRHSKPIVVTEPAAHYEEDDSYKHRPEEVELEHIHYNHQPEHFPANHHEYHAEAEVVSITERSKGGPHNYHALQPTLAPTPLEVLERHHPKRMAPFTKEQFEKARRMMMNKSKRNRGSTKQEKSAAKMPTNKMPMKQASKSS